MSKNKVRINKSELAIYDGQFFSNGHFAYDVERFGETVALSEPYNTLIGLSVEFKKDTSGIFQLLEDVKDDDKPLSNIFNNTRIGNKADITNISRGSHRVVLCEGDKSNKLSNSVVEFNSDYIESLSDAGAELFFDDQMTTLLFVDNGEIIAVVMRTSQESLDIYNDFEATSNIVLSVGQSEGGEDDQ